MTLCNKSVKQSTKPAENHKFKIIGECAHLIDNTFKPTTYFSKYDLLLETLCDLSEFEQQNTFSAPCSDCYSKQFKEMQAAMEDNTQQFLRRTYAQFLTSLSGLKTKRGKMNHFENYLKSFEPYLDKFTPKNLKLLEEIKKAFLNQTYQW